MDWLIDSDGSDVMEFSSQRTLQPYVLLGLTLHWARHATDEDDDESLLQGDDMVTKLLS